MELAQRIEAILFYKGEPVPLKALAQALNVPAQEIDAGLSELEALLKDRGVRLSRAGETVELRTAPEASALIEALRKEEFSKELGKAGSETLAIILYQGAATRGEIDFIRGVNSTFILRSLMIRGLVERAQNAQDGRGYSYQPTHELLAHLGITRIEDLPEYEKIRSELESFKKERTSAENHLS